MLFLWLFVNDVDQDTGDDPSEAGRAAVHVQKEFFDVVSHGFDFL
jgi:hypothetical protein